MSERDRAHREASQIVDMFEAREAAEILLVTLGRIADKCSAALDWQGSDDRSTPADRFMSALIQVRDLARSAIDSERRA
jgi:hypothetical protein